MERLLDRGLLPMNPCEQGGLMNDTLAVVVDRQAWNRIALLLQQGLGHWSPRAEQDAWMAKMPPGRRCLVRWSNGCCTACR